VLLDDSIDLGEFNGNDFLLREQKLYLVRAYKPLGQKIGNVIGHDHTVTVEDEI